MTFKRDAISSFWGEYKVLIVSLSLFAITAIAKRFYRSRPILHDLIELAGGLVLLPIPLFLYLRAKRIERGEEL